MNEDEKTPQADVVTRVEWLEGDIENHESKLERLDEELAHLRTRIGDVERQRRNLLSYLNEAHHKLSDLRRIVELETEVASLRLKLPVEERDLS